MPDVPDDQLGLSTSQLMARREFDLLRDERLDMDSERLFGAKLGDHPFQIVVDLVNEANWVAGATFNAANSYVPTFISDRPSQHFNPVRDGFAIGIPEVYWDEFTEAVTPRQATAIRTRLLFSLARKQRISDTGFLGWLGLVGAGLTSPETALPLGALTRILAVPGGVARLAGATRPLVSGAAIGFGSAALSEIGLQSVDIARRREDAVFNLVGSTIFGGLVGSGGAAFARGRQALLKRELAREYTGRQANVAKLMDGSELAGKTREERQELIAAALRTPSPDLARLVVPGGRFIGYAASLLRKPARWLSPNWRTRTSPSDETRFWMAHEVDDALLREGDIINAPVAVAVEDSYSKMARTILDVHEEWVTYRKSGGDDFANKKTFNEAVGNALANDGKARAGLSDNGRALVERAAAINRRQFEEWLDLADQAFLIAKDDVDLKGTALSYFTRVYDHNKIILARGQPGDLHSIARDWATSIGVLNPERAADEWINTVLGSPTGFVPLDTVGIAGQLRERMWLIPDNLIAPFLVRDAQEVMSRVAYTLIPQIESALNSPRGGVLLGKQMRSKLQSAIKSVEAGDFEPARILLRETRELDLIARLEGTMRADDFEAAKKIRELVERRRPLLQQSLGKDFPLNELARLERLLDQRFDLISEMKVKGKVPQLENQIRVLDSDLQVIGKELIKSEQAVGELAELATAREGTARNLADAKTILSRAQRAEKKLDIVVSRHDRHTKELAGLTKRLKEARRRIRVAKAERRPSVFVNMTREAVRIEPRIKRLRSEISKTKIEPLKAQLPEARRRVTAAQSDVALLTKKVEDFDARLGPQDLPVAAKLRSLLADQDAIAASTKGRVRERNLKRLARDVVALGKRKAGVTQTTRRLAAVMIRRGRLLEKLNPARKANAKLAVKLDGLNSDITKLLPEVAARNAENAKVLEDIVTIDREIDDLGVVSGIEKRAQVDFKDTRPSEIADILKNRINGTLRREAMNTVNWAPFLRRGGLHDQGWKRYIDANSKPNTRKRAKLERQRERERLDAQEVRDMILNRNRHIDQDPSSLVLRAERQVSRGAYVTTMGAMMIASTGDVAGPIFNSGFKSWVPAVRFHFQDWFKEIRDLVRARGGTEQTARIQSALQLTNVSMMGRVARLADIDEIHIDRSRFEKAQSWLQDRFTQLTGLPYWTAIGDSLSSYAGTNTLIDIANSVRGGKPLSRFQNNFRKLAFLTEDDLIEISRAFEKHGQFDKGQALARIHKWTDSAEEARAAQRFERGLIATNRRSIIMPTEGEVPRAGNYQIWRLAFLFKRFAFNSTTKIAVAGLQRWDSAVMSGLTALFTLGALQYPLRQFINGREISEDPLVWIREAVDRSGMMGILMDYNNIGEKLTNGRIGISPILGIDTPPSRYATPSKMGALLGPGYDYMKNAINTIGIPFEEQPTQSDTRAARRFTWFNNLFYLRWLFDAAEEGVNEAFRIPERARSAQ